MGRNTAFAISQYGQKVIPNDLTPQRARRSMVASGPAGRSAVAIGLAVAVLWVVQIFDSIDHYDLVHYGIYPRTLGRIQDIFAAPFIHLSYSHLADNTVPLLVLGFLVGLRGLWRLLFVSAVVVVVSGLGVFLTASGGTDTVGASGVIFGFFGYLVVAGVLERRVVDLVIAFAVGVLYWTLLPGILPGHHGISWQAHLFGLIGGALAAALLARRATKPEGEPRHSSP